MAFLFFPVSYKDGSLLALGQLRKDTHFQRTVVIVDNKQSITDGFWAPLKHNPIC